MPRFSPASFKAHVRQAAPGAAVVVLHGPNAGLQSDLSKTVLKHAGFAGPAAMSVVRLDAADLDADPHRLFDEILALPMFDERRAVIVRASARRIPHWVAQVCAIDRGETLALFLAPDVVADLTDAPDVWSVECAADTAHVFAAFVADALAEFSLTLDPPALDAMLAAVGEDRLAALTEIEKLACYLGAPGMVDRSVVDAVVCAGARDFAAPPALAALEGRTQEVCRLLDQTSEGAVSGVQSAARLANGAHRAKARRWQAREALARLSEPQIRDIALRLAATAKLTRIDSALGSVRARHALLSASQAIAARLKGARNDGAKNDGAKNDPAKNDSVRNDGV